MIRAAGKYIARSCGSIKAADCNFPRCLLGERKMARAEVFNQVAAIPPKSDEDEADLWVFGYGSLIWRPGFPYLQRCRARLLGLHRALCVYSFFHRGTPERPGLVLGLDRGGACRGIAYRVSAAERAATIAYLREREQVTSVYREAFRRVTLLPSGETVSALCYVVDRGHPQYAGRLSLAEQMHFVRQGHGRSGPNREYITSTVQALESLGFRDRELHVLSERLHGVHEAQAAEIASAHEA